MSIEQIGGRYRVIERIGKGAMGVVYKAHDPVLDRVVAIKKMVDEIGEDDVLRGRFHAEARAAARLNHPNIVTIYELADVAGEIFIVMELLEGIDLATMLRRKVPMTPAARLSIISQLCAGLDFAHQHGIVHRDIKPANLHLSPSGVVKILDFGIARLASSNMTNTGALLGTPDYMSPEQVNGEPVDARSDLFAVGAVFYELVSGGRPFQGTSVPSILMKIASEPHEPIRERAPHVPEPVAALIDRLMAKDRNARPASAGAVVDEIRAISESENDGGQTAAIEIGDLVTEQTLLAATRPPGTPHPTPPPTPALKTQSLPAPDGPGGSEQPGAVASAPKRRLVPAVIGLAACLLSIAAYAGWQWSAARPASGDILPTSSASAPAAPPASAAVTGVPLEALPQPDRVTEPIAAGQGAPLLMPAAKKAAESAPAAALPATTGAPVAGTQTPSAVRPQILGDRLAERSPTLRSEPSAIDSPASPDPSEAVASNPVRPAARGVMPDTLETLTGKRSAQGLEMFNAGPTALASLARIRDVLDRYARAVEQRDVETVRSVRTDVSTIEQKLLARGVQVTSYRLSDVNVDANGADGRATCVRTIAATLETGEAVSETARVSITLLRRPGGWVITDIR